MNPDITTPGAEAGDRWSSPAYPVLAATGSAAGLGSLWLFPSLVRQYGGGAFVLAYLAAMLLVGLPLLMAELSLGRLGGADPLRALAALHRHGAPRSWTGLPIALTGMLALSACGLFGGWALAFAWPGVAGQMDDGALPLGPLAGQTLFLAVTAAIVAGGMRRGVERALRWIVPALLALLLALVCFAMVTSDRFGQSVALLGMADFSRLGASGLVAALGLALLTVAAGCGVMLGLGAHACRSTSLAHVAVAVIAMDIVVALLAALAVFPVLLAAGTGPADGLDLLFVTLPPAFAGTAGGGPLAAAFFSCVVLAALAAAVSLLVPAVHALRSRLRWRRPAAAAVLAAGCWALGAGALLLGSRP